VCGGLPSKPSAWNPGSPPDHAWELPQARSTNAKKTKKKIRTSQSLLFCATFGTRDDTISYSNSYIAASIPPQRSHLCSSTISLKNVGGRVSQRAPDHDLYASRFLHECTLDDTTSVRRRMASARPFLPRVANGPLDWSGLLSAELYAGDD
jgi:hypothetical protein